MLNNEAPVFRIFSSRKKSFFLLIGCLAFVIGGIYAVVNAEESPYRNSPLYTRSIGIASILFFGPGIYLSIKQLLKNQLILEIGKEGLNINPKKLPAEYIEWKDVKEFSELNIARQKLIIIEVNNSDYWIDREENKIRKRLMKFNLKNYGSPFNLSANSTQFSHSNLMKVLNESLDKFKY